jgi:hypothetical protein
MKNTKLKIYDRAYAIRINGKTIKVVNGEKAGRFAKPFQTSSSNRKVKKVITTRIRTKKSLKRNTNAFRSIFTLAKCLLSEKSVKCILFIILVAWCLSQVAVRNEIKKINEIESVEAHIAHNIITVRSDFESAEIPSEYKEPDLFDKYFKEDAKIMRAICTAESGLKDIRSHQKNKNGTYDWGRCQINDIHAWRVGGDITKVLDPDLNIKVAYDIYLDRKAWDDVGWTAWSKYNNGDYLKNL